MKILGLILILIFILGGVFGAIPEVTQINYDPSPAVPGSTITLMVQIENLDDSQKNDVYVSILDNYPFIVKETNERNIGNMGPRGKTITLFKVYIEPSAQNKQYDIEIKVSEGKDSTAKIKRMPIIVSGSDPSLKVMDISKSRLIPGQETKILIDVKNIGTSSAYDITVELKEDRIVTQTGQTVEREITPLGSAIGYITKLKPTESGQVEINVSVNRRADLKNYTLPVTISYRNNSGEKIEETSYIGFKVSGPVILDAALRESNIFIAGETKDITLELFNKGSGRAEFTIIYFDLDFGETQREKLFIGSLESNDIDSFRAKISVDPNAETKNSKIRLIVDYQDSDATNKQKVLEIPVKVYSQADGAALTPFNPTGLIINIIIVLIIVVIGWKGYKKYKNKKD